MSQSLLSTAIEHGDLPAGTEEIGTYRGWTRLKGPKCSECQNGFIHGSKRNCLIGKFLVDMRYGVSQTDVLAKILYGLPTHLI